MVRKRNISKQAVQQLTDEFLAKTRLVDKLRQENTELQSKQEILLAFYDILKILQQQKSMDPGLSTAAKQLQSEQLNGLPQRTTTTDANGTSVAPDSVSLSSKNASKAEAAAFGLQNRDSAGTSNEASVANSSGSGDSGDAAADEAQLKCVAPAGDPLYIFKSALSRPQLVQDGISTTIGELQAGAIKTVKELYYLLYQYEKGTYKTAYAVDDPARPQPLKQMLDELLQHFRRTSLAAFGGSLNTDNLMYTAMPFDGSGKAGGPQEVNLALYSSTVRQLDLSIEQMDRMLLGVKAFQGVFDLIEHEMRGLLQDFAVNDMPLGNQQNTQQQQQQTESTPVQSGNRPADVAALQKVATWMSTSSSLCKHLGILTERQSRLERLPLLMNKTFLVQCALLAYVLGCMNVLQCAKAFVGVSPFPLLVVPFCHVVAQHKQQVEEEQQQQRVAAASKSQNKP